MKKLISILTISTFCISSISANELVNSNQTIKSSPKSSSYNSALNSFRNKKYKESYELFNELFFNDMGNILVNFYLGRSAYELGKYEFAISAYDRILIVQPDNSRVRLELAQTYMKMDLYAQSIKEFEIVLNDKKIPSQVKKQIESKIRLMKNKQKKHFYNITAMTGILYDSNINATPSTGAFDIYNPTIGSTVTINNSDEEKSSSIYQTVGQFNHKYRYSDNFILSNSVTALQMKYNNHKEKDVQALSLSTTPTYLQDTYKLSLALGFDKINLGHKSYQHNFYINPTYTKMINSSFLYDLGLKFGDVNFDKEKDKNAHIYELQNSLKYLTKDYGLFSFGLNIGKEKEIKEVRTDIDHKYYTMYITNSYDFMEDYTLLSSLNYKILEYSDNDINFLSKREDKKSDVSISIQKPIFKEILLNVGTTYTHRDSNHASSDYDKYSMKMNLLWNYNID